MSAGLIILAVTFLILVCSVMFIMIAEVLGLDENTSEKWNKLRKSLKRKTKVEKEIIAIQKEVDELKKQKEQLEELEELKRHKEYLINHM